MGKRPKEFGPSLFKEWVLSEVKKKNLKYLETIKQRLRFWPRSPISNQSLSRYRTEYLKFCHLVDHGFIVDHTAIWGEIGHEISIIARTYLPEEECCTENFPGLKFLHVPQEELLGFDENGPVPGRVIAITICDASVYTKFFLAELEFLPPVMIVFALPAFLINEGHYISFKLKNGELAIDIEKERKSKSMKPTRGEI